MDCIVCLIPPTCYTHTLDCIVPYTPNVLHTHTLDCIVSYTPNVSHTLDCIVPYTPVTHTLDCIVSYTPKVSHMQGKIHVQWRFTHLSTGLKVSICKLRIAFWPPCPVCIIVCRIRIVFISG